MAVLIKQDNKITAIKYNGRLSINDVQELIGGEHQAFTVPNHINYFMLFNNTPNFKELNQIASMIMEFDVFGDAVYARTDEIRVEND